MNDTTHPTFAFIQQAIDSNKVFLFMKGTPDAPNCGFSALTVQILNLMDTPYGAFDVLSDGSVREGIKQFSEWPTIPQLYVNGEFVGGCDIVREMYESGELKALLHSAQDGSS